MKKEIRKEFLKKRINMDESDVIVKSKAISDNFIKTNIFKNHNVFALTSAIKNEVDTFDLTKYLLDIGKRVVFPKIIDNKMNFYEIKNTNDFKEGYYKILEPISDVIIDKNMIDVVFTPGVAFSKNGYRVGFGGGFYDRFFNGYKGLRIGLCYDWQLIDFSHEVFDEKVNMIITENEIIDID